ncbi:MAG: selenocysteine synthase [Candidatus Brocadia fulgida]|uniref:Selenocysteine synthase n=1 Tax=Candidatus Brocadia fulgida TaxID=380242 RepID=A0A0M2UT48_9BACT|nr:MAG: selenocysteine synthase [Candidatus Brocadia fulgida]
MHQDILRSIPSVNELLASPDISKFTGRYPRLLVVETIRAVLENIRQSLTNKKECAEAQAIDLSPQRLYHLVQESLRQKFCGIEHAINATGIILHTGLGRAPLADEAARQIQNVLKGFCTWKLRS